MEPGDAVASRSWEWLSADSQQENGAPPSYNHKEVIPSTTQMSRFSPRASRQECNPTKILALAQLRLLTYRL